MHGGNLLSCRCSPLKRECAEQGTTRCAGGGNGTPDTRTASGETGKAATGSSISAKVFGRGGMRGWGREESPLWGKGSPHVPVFFTLFSSPAPKRRGLRRGCGNRQAHRRRSWCTRAARKSGGCGDRGRADRRGGRPVRLCRRNGRASVVALGPRANGPSGRAGRTAGKPSGTRAACPWQARR